MIRALLPLKRKTLPGLRNCCLYLWWKRQRLIALWTDCSISCRVVNWLAAPSVKGRSNTLFNKHYSSTHAQYRWSAQVLPLNSKPEVGVPCDRHGQEGLVKQASWDLVALETAMTTRGLQMGDRPYHCGLCVAWQHIYHSGTEGSSVKRQGLDTCVYSYHRSWKHSCIMALGLKEPRLGMVKKRTEITTHSGLVWIFLNMESIPS